MFWNSLQGKVFRQRSTGNHRPAQSLPQRNVCWQTGAKRFASFLLTLEQEAADANYDQ